MQRILPQVLVERYTTARLEEIHPHGIPICIAVVCRILNLGRLWERGRIVENSLEQMVEIEIKYRDIVVCAADVICQFLQTHVP